MDNNLEYLNNINWEELVRDLKEIKNRLMLFEESLSERSKKERRKMVKRVVNRNVSEVHDDIEELQYLDTLPKIPRMIFRKYYPRRNSNEQASYWEDNWADNYHLVKDINTLLMCEGMKYSEVEGDFLRFVKFQALWNNRGKEIVSGEWIIGEWEQCSLSDILNRNKIPDLYIYDEKYLV